MMRYLRLYAKFIEFSFGRAMEFRLDFYFRIVMDVLYYAIAFAFFKVLFLHSTEVGGWNQAQCMIFVGAFIVIDAVNMTLFSNNVWYLPQQINKGDLDYLLVRPVSSFFIASCRDFAVNSFVNLLMALALLIWAMAVYPGELSFGRIVLFTLTLVNGSLMFHLLRLLFMLPVFWTHSGRGLEPVFWSIERFMERPYGIYKGGVRIALLTVLPFSVMASVPTDILFTSDPWPLVAISVVVGAGLFAFTLGVWNFGLRSYSSASS